VEAWGFSPTKNTPNQKAFRPGLSPHPPNKICHPERSRKIRGPQRALLLAGAEKREPKDRH